LAGRHGAAGPSDGRSTSVGPAAIQRFLLPVVYQNMAPQLLPLALRDDYPSPIPAGAMLCRRRRQHAIDQFVRKYNNAVKIF